MVTADDIDWARKLVSEKPSASYLQRKMLIGYNDALTLMDILVQEGILRNVPGGSWIYIVDQQSGKNDVC